MSTQPFSNANGNIAELQYQIAVYEDQSAYKSLFLLLFPSLQNFAFSIVKSRMLAEEIASDLMLGVWERRKMLLEIDNLQLYLLVSAKNAAVYKLKQENKQAKFSIEDLQVEFVSEYSNPDQTTELHDLENHIAQAVKALPPSCQLIYKLAKEEKLRYKEIAALLDLSVKTIDNQLAIALKKIATVIQTQRTKKNTR